MTPVHAFLDAYCTAVLAKDVDAFAGLYDEDVEVFDMWGAWSLQGISAWRGMAAEWFASLGNETVQVETRDVCCTAGPDLAVGHAILTFTARSAAGETLRSLDKRITVALRRTDDSWRVIHEHTSAPIHPQTTKAIFNYRPPEA